MRYSADVPERGAADVIVAGGGIAGVAAALAARRAGADTILLEKTISLGGLATMGLVIMYLPLCDGRGHQVIGGIGEELLRLCVEASGSERAGRRPDEASIPDCWDRDASPDERRSHRFRAEFTATPAMLAMEALLVREGVRIVYDTVCMGVTHRGGASAADTSGDASDGGSPLAGLVTVDKGGLGHYRCGAAVDATGDADLCLHAGEQIVSQAGNVRCGWFYYVQDGTLEVARMTEPYDRHPAVVPDGSIGFACEDGASVTGQILGSRDLIRHRLERLRTGEPGSSGGHDAVPIVIPQVPTFRMTRRLRGEAEPTAQDSLAARSNDVGMTGDWRKAGPVYHIPFGSLHGSTPNLFAAGRLISVADDLWDATRAIPTCAMTGQAAGVAAALTAELEGDRPAAPAVRETLVRQGALVEWQNTDA